jgi:hypothetical protein
MVVDGGLKDSGTDGTREALCLYWLVNGGGWWTERQWDRWDISKCMFSTGY